MYRFAMLLRHNPDLLVPNDVQDKTNLVVTLIDIVARMRIIPSVPSHVVSAIYLNGNISFLVKVSFIIEHSFKKIGALVW